MVPTSAAIVGLGRVGMCFATFLASKGVLIKGVESDPQRRKMISLGKIYSNEPSLDDLFKRYRDRIEVMDLKPAITSTNISFVVVPTPARPDGSLSDDILRQVVNEIAVIASESSRRHTIVVVSTVSPGTVRNYLSSLPYSSGGHVKVCYSPVFVALGSVLDNLEKPSFILIGGDNAETVEEVASFYTEVGYKDSLIIRTDVLNAEIAKLALNAFLATKITFANFVAAICDRMPGADVNSVLGIIAQDSRVGGGCLRAGPPFGGPCLPRDNEAILNLSERSGVEPILMSAVRNSNEHWYYSLLETVSRQVPSADAVIAVIGLTYKPNTDYTEDGFGLRLAKDLAQRGYKVIAHDPVFDEDHRKTITNFEFCDDINAVLGRSDVCVLTWADEQIAYLVAQATGLICLIDLWGSTQKVKELISPSTSWLSIGKNPLVEGEKSEAIRK